MRRRSSKTETRLGIILLSSLVLVRTGAAETATPEPAATPAAKPLNRECLKCHGHRWGDSEEASAPRIVETLAASVHGPMDMACVDCHRSLQGKPDPHPARLPKPDCSPCHEDAVKAYDQGVHAEARRKSGESDAAWCSQCHGTHDIRTAKDPESRTYPSNLPATCSKCHADEIVIAKARIEAGNVPARFQDSIHGRAPSGSGVAPTPNCAICHGSHAIRRASDEKSRVYRANVPKVCGTCHAGTVAAYDTGVHARALREGNPRAAVCIDCHTAHDTKVADAAFLADVVRECGTCHKESARAFRDIFHERVTALGLARTATCADCHGTHAILPEKDPRSTVSAGHRTQTCRKCHPAATDRFSQYDPHADARSRERSPLLFYTSQAMRLLLIAVLAFFGLHTLLWLARSLVLLHRRRRRGRPMTESKDPREAGPKPSPHPTSSPAPGEGTQFVLRFRRSERLLHGMLMASFFILALTGMPLLFPERTWAGKLAGLVGGYRVTGLLHRIAAATLIFVFLIHLGRLAYRLLVKKDHGMLWGPRSLVPQPIDVLHLVQHFRWFLGLGPRPRFDRYSYWEKFDYWAVFWGMAIIGSSGLLLWFPALFARFLPGWVFNVALVVHGEEALLAVVFIFIVHFFNSHLRPDKFPMDLVMFTGRVSLRELERERPAEYERIAAAGHLDEFLAAAPSPRLANVGRVVGTIAVLVGLIVAALVLHAMQR